MLFQSKYAHDARVHNTRDAEILVPYFMKLVPATNVVDVGCGLGTFLKVFKDNQISKVLGIEGKWLDQRKSLLSLNELMIADLEKPLRIPQRFDLALCLEVAEHLKEESADVLVESLVNLSDYIIFSAGIPFQGGQNHINEQWPIWWENKFTKHNYHFYDVIRPEFWDREDVFWWYKQNMFLVINDKAAHHFEKKKILNLVHPELFTFKAKKLHRIVTGKYDLPSLFKHFFLGIIKLPWNLFEKK